MLPDQKVIMELNFYHPNPEHFAEICRRFFRDVSYNYPLARRKVSIPALLNYTGYPLAENQFCFRHKGHGRALWSFVNEDGDWFFKCLDAGCGLKGDVIEMWYQMVSLSGSAPHHCWDKSCACGDLLARAESGLIDLSVNELESRQEAEYPPRQRGDDVWSRRLEEKIKQSGVASFAQSKALPSKGVALSIGQAVKQLFPEDGYLLVTPRTDWQSCNIDRRDAWLSSRYREACQCSFISSNYLSRPEMRCSFAGMTGVKRRWMIIEGDEGTLEEQFCIHKQLAKSGHLACLLYSGGKSLHGWYAVDDWSEEQRYELFATAIDLGIRDINTWRICQPVRLPAAGTRRISASRRY
jgi:hypothetical protein